MAVKNLELHRKTLAKAARDKYRGKRLAYAHYARVSSLTNFRIKILDAVSTERNGADRSIQTGTVYDSKDEIFNRACEAKEYHGLTFVAIAIQSLTSK